MFGKTPYGAADAEFNTAFILFKRVVCAKIAMGDRVNVAFMDTFQSEYVRAAFDPDVSRMGEGAPMCIYVKDGIVHHLQQRNHKAEELVMLLVSGTYGVLQTEPIPYPVNKYTIFWEYAKMFAVKEKIFFGAIYKFLKKYNPESPIIHRIIFPYFLDGSKYTYKQAGRRIIVCFYIPVAILSSIILYIIWRMFVACLCRRKQMANRHGSVHAAAAGPSSKKTEKVE
jgi:hypothetical protein